MLSFLPKFLILKSDTTKDKEENSSCLDMKQAPLTFRQSTFFSSLKNSLTSKQVNALSKRSLQLIDRIENLNRILWALEIYIKSDIFNKENCQEIISIFNELKEVQGNIDLIYRLKSTRLVELVLELIERKKHISPDEIVGLI